MKICFSFMILLGAYGVFSEVKAELNPPKYTIITGGQGMRRSLRKNQGTKTSRGPLTLTWVCLQFRLSCL